MTRFDRHIIRRFLTGILSLLGSLIVFFIVLHYVEYIDDFMDRGATVRQVFLVYYPNYIPELVRLTSPLAVFLSCMYLTGKLAQELQVVALQTAGVSLYRFLRPFVFVGLLVTGFMFWFNGWVVPRTNATVVEFELRYLKNASQDIKTAEIHRQNGRGNVITVGYYDRDTRTAHRVSLQRYDAGRWMNERIDASRMYWIDSLRIWRLENVTRRTFTRDGKERLEHLVNEDTLLDVQPRDLARTTRDLESMTVEEAHTYIESERHSGAGGIEQLLVRYNSRLGYPIANLILILVAVPLASVRRRGGQAMQIFLSALIAFSYLVLMKLIEPFGYAGEIDPLVAAWLPHGVFLAIALLLLIGARK